MDATYENYATRRRDVIVEQPPMLALMAFYAQMLMENVCIVVKKYILQQCFRFKFVLDAVALFTLLPPSKTDFPSKFKLVF